MKSAKYNIVLFYSHYDGESQRTRRTIHKFMQENFQSHKIDLKEVNYDIEKKLCTRYAVKGTPTVLIHKHEKTVARYFGVITYEEFEAIMQHASETTGSKTLP